MAALPLGKLLYLAVRQVSKPLSKRVQKYAVEHDTVRTYVVIPLGQSWNWVSVRVQRILAGSARKDVRPLSEAEATADGSELLSEAFVFVVAAAVITNEYVVAAKKSAAKSEELDRTLEELRATVTTLEQEVHLLMLEQQRQVERLNQELTHLTAMLAKGQRPVAPPAAATQNSAAAHATPKIEAAPASSCCIM